MTRNSCPWTPDAMDAAASGGRRRHGWGRALACAVVVALAPMDARAVVAINLPWVRVSAGAASAEAYMEIASSANATLVEVRSDAARKVALRSPGKRIATIAAVPLPAGTPVMLAPDGFRVGLLQLKRPLKPGDQVPLILTIRDDDGTVREIPINAEVRRRSAIDDHRHPHVH